MHVTAKTLRGWAMGLLAVAPNCDTSQNPSSASPADAAPAGSPGERGPSSEPHAAIEPGAPGIPWTEKTFEQRQEWMAIAFFPAMKETFEGHDDVAFKTFRCQTCHGEDMKARDFRMPTDSIYPLDEHRPIESAMEYDQAITRFMIEVVVPESARLLDTTPFDPETGEGFGCFGCHPKV